MEQMYEMNLMSNLRKLVSRDKLIFEFLTRTMYQAIKFWLEILSSFFKRKKEPHITNYSHALELSQVDLWEPLPYLIYGILGTVTGVLTFLLPETLGQKLPQTVDDVINLGK